MQPVPSSLSPLPSPVMPKELTAGTAANPEITANSKVATTTDPDPDPDRLLSSYDYFLPESQIAQAPAVPRDCSRLLVVGAQDHQHRLFYQLSSCLQPGDLLVMNDTRVIPARLLGHKLSSSRARSHHLSSGQPPHHTEPKPLEIEVLLLEEHSQRCWLALVRPGRRLKPGSQVKFGDLTATILETDLATRGRILEFDLAPGESLLERLEKLGQLPLPPYIHNSTAQPEQYQTVYAHNPGAVAAPTAGLHFTPEVLENLQQNEIDHCFLTLHVGVGTFRPVESAKITDHQMHQEWVNLPAQTVEKIQQTQARGGRVIAVGTTVVRALEGAVQQGGLQPWQGKTNLFIYPGYRWQVVQGMITNFHLPRSSLLMLVSALIGRERLLQIYQAAIDAQYRFYSFGDAMLILPEAVLPEVRVGCDVGNDSGTH